MVSNGGRWQLKPRDGVGQRCLVSQVESLDASRTNVALPFRAAFQCSGSSPRLPTPEQMQPHEYSADPPPREGRGERCKLPRLSETACRHSVGQLGRLPEAGVGYVTQSTRRGRVKAASRKVMPVFAST